MKLILVTIAVVVLVGCGNPSKSLYEGIKNGHIEHIKKAISDGADVNSTINEKVGSSNRFYNLLRGKGFKSTAINKSSYPIFIAFSQITIVHKGDIKVLRTLIDEGADLSVKGNTGNTILHNAVYSMRTDIVELLIKKGADVNAKNKSMETPLHFAAFNGQKEIAELLIGGGADVDSVDNFGNTPLDNAKRNSAMVNPKDTEVETPFDLAFLKRYNETADLLRKHGGKTSDWLNADDYIHAAASAGRIDSVKKHLSNGVDVNAKDKGGFTALDWAKDHPETANLLIKNGAKTGEELKAEAAKESVLIALEIGSLKDIKNHLSKGIDINEEIPMVQFKHEKRASLLHGAVLYGGAEVIEFLINSGANVNAKDGLGNTPFDYAFEHSNIELQKNLRNLLAKYGGKPSGEYGEIDEDLIGIDEDGDGVDAYDEMITGHSDNNPDDRPNYEEIDEKLSKIDVYKSAKETSMYYLNKAVKEGNAKAIRQLLSAGININVRKRETSTPLDFAIKYKQTEIADLLRKHGGKTAEELKAEEK